MSSDRARRRERDRARRLAGSPSGPGIPLALIVVGLVMFVVVVGVRALDTVAKSTRGRTVQRCEINDRGVAVRRARGVGELEQLAEGEVGDRYRSPSGCVPGDRGLTAGD